MGKWKMLEAVTGLQSVNDRIAKTCGPYFFDALVECHSEEIKMIFERAQELTTVIDIGLLERNPKYLFEHFMNYGDEVFYITEDGSLCGIVTPGDVIRSYQARSLVPRINRDFSYVSDEEDYQGAERILKKIPTIHEVAVVRDRVLLGVLRNGSRKSGGEWAGTRERLQDAADELEHDEWLKNRIQKLLERENRIFVYRYLSVEDMGLTEDERKIYAGRMEISDGEQQAGGLICMTEKEQKDFFGNGHNSSYAVRLVDSTLVNLRVTFTNGIPRLEDKSDKFCNIQKGHRVVPNAPKEAAKKIFLFGPCAIYGLMVEDGQTVGAYLQRQLLEDGFPDYEVVNCALVGNSLYERLYERLFSEEIGAEDILILMTEDYELWTLFVEQCSGKLHCMESMREIWRELERPLSHICNHAMHCDAAVSEKIAEKMFRDIKSSLTRERTDGSTVRRTRLQNYYISWNTIKACRKELKKYVKISEGRRRIGAVEVTCNPFTKGHRYLIEQAYGWVDYLYVFVLEEDRFAIPFEDRMEMVRCGVSDLKNIMVLPTGKHWTTEETFPQYFHKEQVREVEDMSYDVHIFGEVIAKELGITFRFLGEEPFDKVTAKYNETAKEILPGYGIEVVEIPRLSLSDGEIVSGSNIRKAIRDWNMAEMKKMLPDSTLNYLKEHRNRILTWRL